MSNLSRHQSILSLLTGEQRTSLLGVQTALVSDPLYLEHSKENKDAQCIQGLSGEQDGDAKGTHGSPQS